MPVPCMGPSCGLVPDLYAHPHGEAWPRKMSACPAALWVWCRTRVLTASSQERRRPARHSHIEAASSHVTCGTSELPRPPQSRPETEAGTRTGSWVTRTVVLLEISPVN